MSEICLDCWNKYEKTADKPNKFVMSRKPDLCEECGQYKRVIIRYKMRYILADRFAELVENVRYLRKQ